MDPGSGSLRAMQGSRGRISREGSNGGGGSRKGKQADLRVRSWCGKLCSSASRGSFASPLGPALFSGPASENSPGSLGGEVRITGEGLCESSRTGRLARQDFQLHVPAALSTPPPPALAPVEFRVQLVNRAQLVSRAIDPVRVDFSVCRSAALCGETPARGSAPWGHGYGYTHAPPHGHFPSCDLFRCLPGPRVVLAGIPAFSRGQFGLRIFYPSNNRFSIDRKPNHQLLIPFVFSSPPHVQPQHAHVKF